MEIMCIIHALLVQWFSLSGGSPVTLSGSVYFISHCVLFH